MSITVKEAQDRVIASGLLSEHDLECSIEEWRNRSDSTQDGEGLIHFLSQQGHLTGFEADALIAGHTGPYRLGPYSVREVVATGRLGNVFRAVHDEFQQAVSLKIFPASLSGDQDQMMRMGREARVSVEVDHPNVVRSFHMGKVGEVHFLAFEDLQGETLATTLSYDRKLSVEDASDFIRQAALGLAHLHEREIVHRDVQPGNLWIATDGTPKIMEFGAARDALANLDTDEDAEETTQDSTMLGSFDYMAPEQGQDTHLANAQSDIYSLGCTLYHCLTGQPPFPDKNPIRQMLRHANEAPKNVIELSPDVPTQLADVVSSMIAKKPEDRYASANDVAWAMVPFVGEETVAADVDPEEVSAEFLAWSRSSEEEDFEGQASPTPELASFLHHLSDQPKT